MLHELARPRQVRGLDLLGTALFVVGPHRPRARRLARRALTAGTTRSSIGGLVVGVVLLPLFVADRAPRAARRCSTSTIFENRLFAAATAAAFINGLSRFALLFLFVFYFQGAQGDDPITAGIKLAPMAIGMLSPRRSPASGPTATARARSPRSGCSSSAVALAGDDDAAGRTRPTGRARSGCSLVGIGSGMFNSPNTAAMMGTVPAHRRGIAAGARTMLQNTAR